MKYFKCESDIHIKNICQGDSNKKGLFLTLIATLLTVLPAFASAQEIITQYLVGDGPVDLVIGQFNTQDDNYPDIAVANRKEKSFSVLLSDGSGGYKSRVDYPLEGYALELSLVDVNNDGSPDILVTDLDIIGEESTGIYFGDIQGGFQAQAMYKGFSDTSIDIATGDFNNDGLADFVSQYGTGDNGQASIAVSLQNPGTGEFQEQDIYKTGAGGTDIDVADLNGDSNLDVVTANREADSVSVLLGNGAGGFIDRTDYPVGGQPGSVAIGDVNNDGNPDLVSASTSEMTVSVLIGDGSGSFSASEEYDAALAPSSIVVAEVNTDGNADIVIANQLSAVNSGGAVTILPGDGSGRFATKLAYPMAGTITDARVRDMNLDGIPEIISANSGDDVITLLTPLMPATNNDHVIMQESEVVHGVLQAHDLQGDPLTFEMVAQPAHGEVEITNPASGDYEYAPTTDYAGTDSFTFVANDGEYDSAPGTINIIVKPSGQGDNDGGDTGNDNTTSGDGGGSMGWVFIGLLLGASFWRAGFWLRATKSGGSE